MSPINRNDSDDKPSLSAQLTLRGGSEHLDCFVHFGNFRTAIWESFAGVRACPLGNSGIASAVIQVRDSDDYGDIDESAFYVGRICSGVRDGSRSGAVWRGARSVFG